MNNAQIPLQWYNRAAILVVVSWTLLAVLFAMYDLDISVAFVDRNSGWSAFLERWGEHPATYLLLVSILVLAVQTAARIANRLTGKPTQPKSFLPHTLIQFAHATIVMNVVCRLIVVVATKYVWGRVRFKNLSPDYSEFTPWYIINGPNGNASFVSGHSASAWMVLPLIILASRLPRIGQLAVTGLCFAWGFAMAVSRVRIGAHYASDVLFASAVCLLVFTFIMRRLAATGQVLGGGRTMS